MFDVPSEKNSVVTIAPLPALEKPWLIGLIVGPSGSGKTTTARKRWPNQPSFEWPHDKSILDAFPSHLSVKEITGALSSVGFSSPPSWLRPYHALSNGEQFRVTVARALMEITDAPIVIDEFTSVVDRTVAKVTSAAISKALRRRKQQFVAVSCHYDVTDWLQPDWVFQPHTGELVWRSVQSRPSIELEVRHVNRAAWDIFKRHHYLSGDLAPAARCFVALVDGEPAAFTAVTNFPHPTASGWREHRTVCLPDYQGVGIGNAMSSHVAAIFAATSRPYYSTTSAPGMIWHRAKSKDWLMTRKPNMVRPHRGRMPSFNKTASMTRITASFRYVGPRANEAAQALGIIPAIA